MSDAMYIGKKPAENADEGDGDEPSPSVGDVAGLRAAKRVLSALDSGDAKALDQALRAHYEACHGEG